MQKYCVCALLAAGLWAAVPHLIRFSGTAQGAPVNPAAIRFAWYAGDRGGAPLWTETQTVRTTAGGHYTVLLGSTKPEGLPADLFLTGQARWLGIAVDGQPEQPRVLLASAPYALKSGDAETLGGLPPSAFARAAPAAAVRIEPAVAHDSTPDTSCAAIASDGTASANQLAKFTAACTIEPSAIFEAGGSVGIGTTTPAATLDVKGAATLRGALSMNAKGVATAAAGAGSNPVDLLAASFDGSTNASTSQHFRWQAEAAANDTARPAATLNLLYASGSGAPTETGLFVNSKGLMTFAAGQAFPGTATITGLTAGSGLAGGGTAGVVTLGLTATCTSGQELQWNGSKWACTALGQGTITGVTAGAGLTGGGANGNIALANAGVLGLSAGVGIASAGGNAPAVNLDTAFTDGRYLQLSGGALSGPLFVAANGLTTTGNQLVEASGNVGIATAAPGAPLEAAGNVKISGAGSSLTFADGTTQTTAGSPPVNPLRTALLKWFPAAQPPATYNVGYMPLGLVFDGVNIWVASEGTGMITKLLASTGAVVGSYKLASGIIGLAFDGANIWVTTSGNVTKMQASTGAVLGTYTAGDTPFGVAFDGSNVWVTNAFGNTVTKFLAATGAVLGTFNVGRQPQEVAFDGTNIWVANSGDGTVTKLAPATGMVLGTFSTGNNPYGLAFDGVNMWVTNTLSNTVTKMLAATGAVLATYNVAGYPYGIQFDGANIWVACSTGGSVMKLQASSGAVLGTFAAGIAPFAVAFDGANIWVTDISGAIVSKL